MSSEMVAPESVAYECAYCQYTVTVYLQNPISDEPILVCNECGQSLDKHD